MPAAALMLSLLAVLGHIPCAALRRTTGGGEATAAAGTAATAARHLAVRVGGTASQQQRLRMRPAQVGGHHLMLWQCCEDARASCKRQQLAGLWEDVWRLRLPGV